MLLLDETPYQEPKEALQVAPTGTPKASGMAMLKLGVDYMAAVTLVAGGIERGLFGSEHLFEGYDEVYKPIQDRLTPEPGSVTTAGRLISGIAGFAPALALGPAGIPVLAGTGAITTGTELVEQGVDPTTATEAAVLTGAATTVMAGIPAAGKTWGKTLALAATNPLIGAASTEAQKQLLEATGYQEIAGQFDPLDPAGRGIDAVMGLAFGAMGKYGLARREMLTRTKDGIDTVANWQRMFKDTPFDVADPKSADLGYKAMQKALADISAGKPVDLSGVLPDYFRVGEPQDAMTGIPFVGRVFHGSGALELVRDFKDELRGTRTGAPSAHKGFFFSSSEEVANTYAANYESIKYYGGDTSDPGYYDYLYDKQAGKLTYNTSRYEVSLKNPYVVDFKGSEYRETSYSNLIDQAKNGGHDGLIIKNTFDSADSNMPVKSDIVVAFDKTQIKLAKDVAILKGPTTRILAEEAEARAEIAKALKSAEEIGTERRGQFDDDVVLREALESTPREQLHDMLLTDPVSGARTRTAFEILQRENPADMIGISDARGLGAIDKHLGHKAGDDFTRMIVKAHQDEGVPIYRASEKGDEFITRWNGWTNEAASAKLEAVNERLRKSVLEVTNPDGAKRYFTNLEMYMGLGKGKEGYNEAGHAVGEQKRTSQPAGYVKGEFPRHLIELSQERGVAAARGDREAAPRPAAAAKAKPAEKVVSAPELSPQKTKGDIRAEMKDFGYLWQDPTVQRVEQRLAEEGDFPIRTGTDVEGNPTAVSARDFIESAKRDYKALEAQQDVYARIGDCL